MPAGRRWTGPGSPMNLDFASELSNLKEFLKIRDTNDLFIPVKQEGQIGIPCIVREDRSVTLDWESVL